MHAIAIATLAFVAALLGAAAAPPAKFTSRYSSTDKSVSASMYSGDWWDAYSDCDGTYESAYVYASQYASSGTEDYSGGYASVGYTTTTYKACDPNLPVPVSAYGYESNCCYTYTSVWGSVDPLPQGALTVTKKSDGTLALNLVSVTVETYDSSTGGSTSQDDANVTLSITCNSNKPVKSSYRDFYTSCWGGSCYTSHYLSRGTSCSTDGGKASVSGTISFVDLNKSFNFASPPPGFSLTASVTQDSSTSRSVEKHST